MTVTDSAGAGLQMEKRVAVAGLDWLVLAEVQTEDSSESGTASSQQEPVTRHSSPITTNQHQVSVTRVLTTNLLARSS